MIKELSDPFAVDGDGPVWPKIRGFLGRQKRRIFPQLGKNSTPRPVFGFTEGATGALTKKALLIYLTQAFYEGPERFRATGFYPPLQSVEIARAFNRLGYAVDVVDYRDDAFVPDVHYDVCLGMHYNFGRLLPILAERKTRTIYYGTGAYWEFENSAEAARSENLRNRRGIDLKLPERLTANNWVQTADAVIAMGNEFTTSMYRSHNKQVFKIDHVALLHDPPNLDRKDFGAAARRNFLCVSSVGLLHKGLDLVLEAFTQLKDFHLWVCGPLQAEGERDFIRAYRRELFHTPNIHPVGWIRNTSSEFTELSEKCVAAIHASCAEGMPGTVLNNMARGLVPLVSRESSIDTDGLGVLLEDCTVTGIRRTVTDFANMSPEICQRMAKEAYRAACTRYTMESYTQNIERILKTILNSPEPTQERAEECYSRNAL